MSPKLLGLVVGGLLPAVFYGVSGVFAKTSTNAGMPVGGHLICIGVAISGIGVLFNSALPGPFPSARAILSSTLLGILWALGSGFVVLGLLKYQASLAKLVPLYNMNTLVTVILALLIFAEWKEVNLVQLGVGALLVIVGGILVSSA